LNYARSGVDRTQNSIAEIRAQECGGKGAVSMIVRRRDPSLPADPRSLGMTTPIGSSLDLRIVQVVPVEVRGRHLPFADADGRRLGRIP